MWGAFSIVFASGSNYWQGQIRGKELEGATRRVLLSVTRGFSSLRIWRSSERQLDSFLERHVYLKASVVMAFGFVTFAARLHAYNRTINM